MFRFFEAVFQFFSVFVKSNPHIVGRRSILKAMDISFPNVEEFYSFVKRKKDSTSEWNIIWCVVTHRRICLYADETYSNLLQDVYITPKSTIRRIKCRDESFVVQIRADETDTTVLNMALWSELTMKYWVSMIDRIIKAISSTPDYKAKEEKMLSQIPCYNNCGGGCTWITDYAYVLNYSYPSPRLYGRIELATVQSSRHAENISLDHDYSQMWMVLNVNSIYLYWNQPDGELSGNIAIGEVFITSRSRVAILPPQSKVEESNRESFVFCLANASLSYYSKGTASGGESLSSGSVPGGIRLRAANAESMLQWVSALVSTIRGLSREVERGESLHDIDFHQAGATTDGGGHVELATSPVRTLEENESLSVMTSPEDQALLDAIAMTASTQTLSATTTRVHPSDGGRRQNVISEFERFYVDDDTLWGRLKRLGNSDKHCLQNDDIQFLYRSMFTKPVVGTADIEVIVIENQRYIPLRGWRGVNLMSFFGDHPRLSNRDGVKFPHRYLKRAAPPAGYHWTMKPAVEIGTEVFSEYVAEVVTGLRGGMIDGLFKSPTPWKWTVRKDYPTYPTGGAIPQQKVVEEMGSDKDDGEAEEVSESADAVKKVIEQITDSAGGGCRYPLDGGKKYRGWAYAKSFEAYSNKDYRISPSIGDVVRRRVWVRVASAGPALWQVSMKDSCNDDNSDDDEYEEYDI